MTWLCKDCGEKSELQVCWNCGADRGNAPPIDAGPPISDPVLGDLYWDADSECWSGFYPADSEKPFTLVVQTLSDRDRSVSDAARLAFERVRNDLEGIRRGTASELLPSFNEEFLDPPMTLEEFLAALVPEVISIELDGYVEVGFADGTEDDRIGGHILVSRFWPNGHREVVLEG